MTTRFSAPLILRQMATPGQNPPAGSDQVYKRTDHKIYTRDDAGVETAIPPITIGDTAPTGPKPGDLWVATNVGAATSLTNFSVGPNNPSLTGPGLWIQTGLGDDGTGVTFWVEDGT